MATPQGWRLETRMKEHQNDSRSGETKRSTTAHRACLEWTPLDWLRGGSHSGPSNNTGAAALQQRCWPGTAGLLGRHSQGPDKEAAYTITTPKMRHGFSSREPLPCPYSTHGAWPSSEHMAIRLYIWTAEHLEYCHLALRKARQSTVAG